MRQFACSGSVGRAEYARGGALSCGEGAHVVEQVGKTVEHMVVVYVR